MADSTPPLGRLEKMDVRLAWASEAVDFTPWLAREENIALIAEAIGIPLNVEATEKSVGPFSADILCSAADNDSDSEHWVVIENQLERTDHKHLGQLITYAAGLDAATIVWIASDFTEEHRAALDWLNANTSESISFFALKIELWKIGDSPLAPKFDVVSSPNDWKKSVTTARRATANRTESERVLRHGEFFTFFTSKLSEHAPAIAIPGDFSKHYLRFNTGKGNCDILCILESRAFEVRVQLTLYGLRAKTRFGHLFSRRAEIESEIGGELEWLELPENAKCRIQKSLSDVDPKDPKQWERISTWFVEWLTKFHETFAPILKRID
jgi:hypothetical protein